MISESKGRPTRHVPTETPGGDPSGNRRQTRTWAPIALFAFRRPQHLHRTLTALANNPGASESTLHIFCDGPRRDDDLASVQETRNIAAAAIGFREVVVHCSEINRGLARSVIHGVTRVVTEYGRVIVLEDDLVTSPYFLRFMNDGLTLYADSPQVASVHGYLEPVAGAMPETFFLQGADCWGWATWQRAWSIFEPDGKQLLATLKAEQLTDRFDLDGSYPYTEMLRQQVAGKNDSWAIRWHASAFIRGMLTLYPGHSLVENIGLDGTGTHCSSMQPAPQAYNKPIPVLPIPVEVNTLARAQLVSYHRHTARASSRILTLVRRALHRCTSFRWNRP